MQCLSEGIRKGYFLQETLLQVVSFAKSCFLNIHSGMWVIEDPAVIYVRECFAYVLL